MRTVVDQFFSRVACPKKKRLAKKTRICYTIFCRKAGQCRACELCQVWKEAALSRIRHVSDMNRVTASLRACFFICQKPKGAEKGQELLTFSIELFNNTSLCLLGYMGVYLHCCFHVGVSYTFHDRFYRYVQFSK